ncbi:hypothetical protein [Cellulomonas fengjieae]|uniref:hypothetical protein n=1 Tax=Cellulomonas fengjieae TaxID=2819978 RepID=UPI001AAF83BF|nr:hypothetical protein [Cellulomonas fengjieae]MBO3101179.1 hypothetical protein [Cellulomonas fengjieae]
MRTTTGRVAVVLALVAATGLAACGAPLSQDEKDARGVVVDFMRTTRMTSYHPDIEDFVRAAPGGPTLVAWSDEASGSRIGTLTFAVTLPEPPETYGVFAPEREVDPGPYCFAVEMDAHGKVGEFGTPEGIRSVDCPEPLVAVTPPTSDEPVVADNAREAAWQVLADLPSTPDADEVAARITDLLTPEERRVLAEVRVGVDGADVGVAVGGPDDCVLVARRDGTVTDVHVTSVQLQPGEAGCTAGTALAPPDPPH